MSENKDIALASGHASLDPFAILRQMTTDLDRLFEPGPRSGFRFPLRRFAAPEVQSFSPEIDVFERDKHLVTKVDLLE